MRIIKLRGKPLSRGPPRPFWGSKHHERSEGGLEPQKAPATYLCPLGSQGTYRVRIF